MFHSAFSPTSSTVCMNCRLPVTTGNPVLSLSKSGGRFEVIGRVPRLESLNGAAVLARERRDAETRYLQV